MEKSEYRKERLYSETSGNSLRAHSICLVEWARFIFCKSEDEGLKAGENLRRLSY